MLIKRAQAIKTRLQTSHKGLKIRQLQHKIFTPFTKVNTNWSKLQLMLHFSHRDASLNQDKKYRYACCWICTDHEAKISHENPVLLVSGITALTAVNQIHMCFYIALMKKRIQLIEAEGRRNLMSYFKQFTREIHDINASHNSLQQYF